MSAARRLQKEIMEIKGAPVPGSRDLKVDDSNLLVWDMLILPSEVPYNKGAFRVEITFPDQYPFKPPTVVFKTKIFHPNIDEEGRVCLNIINPENWKPATKAKQIVEALIKLVNEPEPDHPLRVELAEDFMKNRAKFNKSAEAFTKKHSEKRPA